AERLGDPVGDIGAGVGWIVEARMLRSALAFAENLQLTLAAVDELIIGALRPMQRDLRVLGAMGNKKRNLDAAENTVEMDVLDDAQEVVDVARTPRPADVLPIVGDREVALALQPLLLHVAPVVI